MSREGWILSAVAAFALAVFAFWATVGYVVWHFIEKLW